LNLFYKIRVKLTALPGKCSLVLGMVLYDLVNNLHHSQILSEPNPGMDTKLCISSCCLGRLRQYEIYFQRRSNKIYQHSVDAVVFCKQYS